jgi:hypothetical protein
MPEHPSPIANVTCSPTLEPGLLLRTLPCQRRAPRSIFVHEHAALWMFAYKRDFACRGRRASIEASALPLPRWLLHGLCARLLALTSSFSCSLRSGVGFPCPITRSGVTLLRMPLPGSRNSYVRHRASSLVDVCCGMANLQLSSCAGHESVRAKEQNTVSSSFSLFDDMPNLELCSPAHTTMAAENTAEEQKTQVTLSLERMEENRRLVKEQQKERERLCAEEAARRAAEPQRAIPVGTYIGNGPMREQMEKKGYTFKQGERCNGKRGAPNDLIDGFVASIPPGMEEDDRFQSAPPIMAADAAA